MLTRRAPHPGQRYRHGWIPVSFADRADAAAHGDDALSLPAIDAMHPGTFAMFAQREQRDDVKDAVFHYMGAGHREINRYLRKGAEGRDAAHVQRYVDRIDDALGRSAIGRDAVVYRGISTPAALFGPRDEWPESLVGAEWRDPAYQSTSTQVGIARDFAIDRSGVVLRILVPRGTPALKLTGANRGEHSQAEGELLLPRGARFRVVADHGPGINGTRDLDVELVDLPSVQRGRPHPGQRYRHGWIPVSGATSAAGGEGDGEPLAPADGFTSPLYWRVYESSQAPGIVAGDDNLDAAKHVKATEAERGGIGSWFFADHEVADPRTAAESYAAPGSVLVGVRFRPADLAANVTDPDDASGSRVTRPTEVQVAAMSYWDGDRGFVALRVPRGVTTWTGTGPPKPEAARAAGRDATPGHDELHHYWTRGEGLAKWLGHPHEWTALYHHLVKYAPTPEAAKRWASAWFHEVKGFWPGSDLHRVEHGKPPRGNRVGPG